MSHEIDTTTGRAAAMFAGQPAWHGLGTVISEAATSAEAIGLAGLDWTVEQWDMFASNGEVRVTAPDRVANVRTDTNAVLGIVGRQYRVFQNAEAFQFMDALVDDKLAMYETAGSLKGGRRVWMLARIPTEYQIAGDDTVKPYVLLTNAHDGTQALRMLPTTVRVVCNNTLNLAVHKGRDEGISIYHYPRLEQQVNEARKALGIITDRLSSFETEAKAMADRKLTTAEAQNYFDGLFPTKVAPSKSEIATDGAALLDSILDEAEQNREVVSDLLAGHFAATERQAAANAKVLDTILTNFDNERNSLPGIEHSAWAAYNAVSEWTDHGRSTRGRNAADRADNRLNSVWFGRSNKVKQQAYSDALSLVK